MEENTRYAAEAASSWFAELQDVYRLLPRYREAYRQLSRTFANCLNDNTRFQGAQFNGPFAKTDYLLKENRAPCSLQRTVHDARVRLRQYQKTDDAVLAANFGYDFKAVCQLVGLVYHVPVPGVLEAVFPAVRTVRAGELRAEYLRLIVNRWDDTFIYADADAENAEEVTVFYGGSSPHAVYTDWDWSYLRPLLREGCQLNIIRPREHQGVLYPELIVWEPDFLVDISAVANSYESYAASPLNHLLGKLKPAPSTQPIVLGNLASQFLDEELYTAGGCPYAQSVQRFFRDHAVSLLTAELSDDFHTQAQNQKANIHNTLSHTLPQVLSGDGIRFDASDIMVEPSFFSEMLGLQGRMDFLELGQKVLIEQKSGKARYPETSPIKQQDKHYLQLLLYMLLIRYNYRDNYDRNGGRLFAFLLYSKYREGLLPLGFAPPLVFAAVRLRNEMAAAEYGYSSSGLHVLETLQADSLNVNHVRGTLWERYQRPQINELLAPVRQASPLERAYYLRFLQFLETEHLMAKIGTQTKENSGFADKWHSTLEEKLLAGNIYCGLTMVEPADGAAGKVERLVLAFGDDEDRQEVSNFRTGDIVILYPYAEGDEPDARRTMVFRATIEGITPRRLVLSLRAPQATSHVFWYQGTRLWAVEHDFFESSFGSLYRGMHAFLSAPRECRDLLLLQRRPEVDASLTLQGDYGAFNELALRVKQARDLFLIIGPPGTGKTSYGLLNTLREQLLSSEEPVLLLSYTNRAVDEICGKLVESGIDFIRLGGRFSCEERYRPYLLDARIGQCSKVSQLKDVISRARVVTATTSAFNAAVGLFQLKTFALAIIDEASQILEPHLIGLLSATGADGACAIRKMVLIGDHKQLPAVVQQSADESAVSEPELRAIHLTDCRLSLFERLLKAYRREPEVTYMLTRQGRMHHDIAQFPNRAFYQGLLQEVPLDHQTASLPATAGSPHGIDNLLATRRIAFVAVDGTPHTVSDKVNSPEAQAIAATLARIYHRCRQTFHPLQTVGVIVPYRNQIAEIRRCVEAYGIEPLRHITIDTVERFQGSQRDFILYGFTIQKFYQLNFLTSNTFEEDGLTIDRKLNVAMTRAREHLLLFGNPRLLAHSPVFSSLLDYVRDRQAFLAPPLDDYLAGRFTL